MEIAGVNVLGVVIAAVAGFVVGMGWYMAFGTAWMIALGKTKEQLKPRPAPFIISAVSLLIMSFMLAGIILHGRSSGLEAGLIAGAAVWFGFVITTIAVNYAFQGAPRALTMIDGGHWLAVLLVMGAILGAFAV